MSKPLKPEEVFESVVQVVQKTFVDHPNTQIHRRYRIPNNAGRKREIDVFIETTVNGINLKVAIECKDLKRKVSVTQIEAFKGKCDRIPRINKMIMVSRSGYQVDAINAANEFGIDLHRLEQISEERVKSWFGPDSIRPGEVTSSLSELAVQFLTQRPEITFSPFDLVYPPNSKAGVSLFEFVKTYVNSIRNVVQPIPIEPGKNQGSEEKYLTIECPGYSLQHNGATYPITAIHATVIYVYRIKESGFIINSYTLPNDPLNPTETATIINEENSAITLVNLKGDRGMDLFLSDKKNSVRYANIKIEKKKK